MKLDPLMSLSPIDGRYADKVAELRPIMSEYGLMRHRLHVEVQWFRALAASQAIHEIAPLGAASEQVLDALVRGFDPDEARRVKEIERSVNHDVKALEYYLKEKCAAQPELAGNTEFFHFACTSEDINNLAWGMMLAEGRRVLLRELELLLVVLADLAAGQADQPMLSRTHGQPASPTTIGKEIGIFIHRLQSQARVFDNVEILGKCNGAVGNFNAHYAAYPEIDWMEFSETFVRSLGLGWNPHTTQIESHDFLAEYLHALIRINTVVIDFCRDIWGYIALGYFRLRAAPGQVGSSTMPHKVNPIDFENAEGNLGLANSTLAWLAEKLPLSRWQRDLTDSTCIRNTGAALAHTLIAWQACRRGMSSIAPDTEVIYDDLDQHWEVLAEAIQTVMRRYGVDRPYERLKELTQGTRVDEKSLVEFIAGLPIPDDARARLQSLTPAHYLGNAEQQARMIAARVKR
jgi:adenylosuccinate lyase